MTFYDDLISRADEATGSLVTLERAEDRAVVTLSDPAKLNVLSAALTLEFKRTLQELVSDRQIRAIVVTGADPGFSAGGDL
ncbi:MAG TPA: enoyl-CoA hydratase/isomerase family protein, partial [Solirubrobacteraceae bacterium]|nr:enoyl-CoA hydratase/isomerase family protein [Solirubrobacteraceae bacterium]